MRKPFTQHGGPIAPPRQPARTLDDRTLLRHLSDGWPVWRIADYYRMTTAEVREAIGAAVTRTPGAERMFGVG